MLINNNNKKLTRYEHVNEEYVFLVQRWNEILETKTLDMYQYNILNSCVACDEYADVIGNAMNEMGIWYTGGKNSPYIWLKCPNNMDSWKFFDLLLNEIQVVGTPGSGFGKNGQGFFRLTAFGNYEDTIEGMNRLKSIL